MDLSLWNDKDCRISMFSAIRLGMGAKPYRCEYCRVNFLSFRPRYERHSFKRWAKLRKTSERGPAEGQSVSSE